jgi:hypothetical protein
MDESPGIPRVQTPSYSGAPDQINAVSEPKKRTDNFSDRFQRVCKMCARKLQQAFSPVIRRVGQYRVRSVLECIADPKADRTAITKRLLGFASTADLYSECVADRTKEGDTGKADRALATWANNIDATNKADILSKTEGIMTEIKSAMGEFLLKKIVSALKNSMLSDRKEQKAESAIAVIQSIAAAKTDNPDVLKQNAVIQFRLTKHEKEDKGFEIEQLADPENYEWLPLAEEKLKKLLEVMPLEHKKALQKAINRSADTLGKLAPKLPGADLGALCQKFKGVVADAVAAECSDTSTQSNFEEAGSKPPRTARTRSTREGSAVGKGRTTQHVNQDQERRPQSLSPAIQAIEAFQRKGNEQAVSLEFKTAN